MASSSSSRKPKYDVFLSFRGEDTRPNILSHLRDRLDDERIDTFKDDTGMERGEKIGPSLLEAIGSATIALIIVSKGYASSKWCLDELVEIMKRRDRGELIVLPIFDHVDPSDVRNPTTGIFADDFTRHEENYKEKAKLWRKAMAQVGKLSGYHLKNCRHEKNSEKEKLWRPDRAQVVFRSEAELLKEVIVDVRKKLKPTQSVCTNEFVGIDSQIEEVKRLLCLDKSDHIRVIGIVGMGGIGKTTIADVTFKQIRSDFESSIFLCVADVLTVSGRTGLAEAFLSGLLGKKVSFSSPCVSNSLDASWLCRKKILVVLDDVNNSKQLEDLIGQNGSSVFGQGSRIIVTSRDKQLLRTICSDGDDSISHVKGLYDDHALQLFCQNAFKQNYPKEDFRDMVWPLLQYADGNPLALKVLGSHLFMKPKSVWESVLNGLNKCQNQDIHNVLRISYDGLDKNQKKIFLHIGCFFADYAEPSRVIEVLDSCGLQTRYGLDVLMDKCLLDVRHPPHCDRGFVSMHSLLREMGREIVREESDDPGKRSILWDSSDIYQVFNKNSGTEAIQGINLGWTEEDVYLNSDAFKKMPNLKFLIFSHANRVHCPSMGLEYLPDELRLLRWDGCPLKRLPINFQPTNLVELSLRWSNLEQLWEGIQDLKKLSGIDLECSKCLIELADLSLAPNLVEIHLSGCRSLVEIPSSMNHLNKLEVLDLGGCTNIRSLPSPIAWRSLVTLCLWGCSELSSFPEIECLDALRELGMSDCITLKSLPDLSLAPNLVEIHLSGCRSLVEIASSMNHLNKLEVLDLGGCTNIRSLPSPIPWRSLGTLCLWGCSELSSFPEIECLDALRQLDMLDCITLKSLPDLSLASNLVEIDLSGCRSLVEIPSSMNHLNKLEYLSLGRCTNIRSLPSPIAWRSLETLCLRGCSELSSFPEIECLDALRKLDMSDCINVKRLSSSICRLKSLEELHLDGCSNLENFSKSTESPQSSGSQLHTNGQLSPLKHLSIKDCYKIRSFPELSGTVFGLKYLDLSHCKLLETVFDLEQLIRGFESEGSSRFFFCNCWKLDVQWSKIAALAKMKIQAEAIYSYLKGTYYEFKMIYPGSEIPKWIKYQNMGRSITIQLPVNKRFLGFALSAVVPAGDSFDCEFYFENTVVDSFSWKESGDSKLSLGSEHVILCYDTIGNDRYNEMVKKLGCRGGYYEVTFDISYCTCNIKRPDVLKCGLVPLYAQNVNYKRLETPLDESETTEVTINPTEDKFEVTINVTEDKFELSVDECQVKNLDQEHILRTYKDVGTEILEVDPLTLSSFCGTLFCVWGNERCKESKAVSTLCSPNEKCSICIDYEGDDECHAQNFDQEQQMFMDFRVQPNPAQAFTNNNRETCALSCSCDHVG